MLEESARSDRAEITPSTKRALGFVYLGYAFRYLYLLVLIPFYGRVLGAAEYGRLVAAMSLFQVVWILTEYGFPAIGARDVAIADAEGRAGLYGRHLCGRSLMAGFGLAVGILGTYISPLLRDEPLLGLLATGVGIASGFNLSWFFQGTLRFRTSVMLEVMGFAISLTMILALVRGPHDTWLVMFGILVSSVASTLTAHAVVLASLDRSAIRWTGTMQLVRDSTALFISRGLAMLTTSASTYLISLFATAAELGWYGAAERLITAGLSLLQPANQVLMGTVARHLGAEDGIDQAFILIRKALAGMLVLGIGMFLGAELLGGFIVPLILGPTFALAVPIVKIMAILFPFAAVNQVVTGYVLIPFRFDRFVPIVSALASLVTLVLIIGLGRTFAGVGVAWARVVGEIVGMALTLVALHKAQLGNRLFAT